MTIVEFDPPDLPDLTDGNYWRALSIGELAEIIAEQMPGRNDEAAVEELVREAVSTVVDDISDRASDQAWCGKADDCRAKSVVLAWLAWNIDAKLLPGRAP
jgi:hypothetical protein